VTPTHLCHTHCAVFLSRSFRSFNGGTPYRGTVKLTLKSCEWSKRDRYSHSSLSPGCLKMWMGWFASCAN